MRFPDSCNLTLFASGRRRERVDPVAAIFLPLFNPFARASVFGGVLGVGLVVWVIGVLYRSPYVTQAGVVKDQPIPFSHEHHVGGLGIDCRYCHTSVEESSFAGM